MTQASRHRRRLPAGIAALRHNDAGAALVEFTLLAPFLLILGLGIAEFGRMFYQYQLVVEGLRDAGRYLARVDPTIGDNQTKAARLAVTGTVEDGGELRVEGWEAGDLSFSIEETPNAGFTSYRGPNPIRVVVVSTTFDYADVGFLSTLGLGAISIGAAHKQRVIDRAWDIVPPPEEEGGT